MPLPPGDLFTVHEAPELIATVAEALPSWLSYHSFDGQPNVRPLAVETVTIDEANIPVALAGLRTIPDAITDTADLEPGWREEDLVAGLRAWGWAADARAGQVRLGGIWSDVGFPVHFAALLAVAPFPSSGFGPWVFGAAREREPSVAVSFTNGGLTVNNAISISYQVAYEID